MFAQKPAKELKSADKIREYLQLDETVRLTQGKYLISSISSHEIIAKKVTEIQEKLSLLHLDNNKTVFRTLTLAQSKLSLLEIKKLQQAEERLQILISLLSPDSNGDTHNRILTNIEHLIAHKDHLMLQKGKSYFTIIVSEIKGLDKLIFEIPNREIPKRTL